MSANSRKVSPLAWVPTVYFAMGLPFIIVNMVATLMFRGLGIDDARITLWTSLIILPWSLKPFWSPLMEMFRTKKFWVVWDLRWSPCRFRFPTFSPMPSP